MKKKLLVVGAGAVQADGIQLARELGYYVHATDGSPGAPGFELADGFSVMDVKDADAHVALSRELGVDGVISYATDICLPTVLAVREILGLPGLGAEPMRISLNKAEQRIRFRDLEVAQPNFEVVESPEEGRKACLNIGVPLIVKPIDSSGSRGVSLVRHPSEIAAALAGAFANSSKATALVEEFVEGVELTVEGLSIDGKHYILAISDKFKPDDSPTSTIEQVYPAPLSEAQRAKVITLINSIYDAAEVDNTPTHAEVIMTSEGPKLVEMACRGCGFFVFTRIIKRVCGYDPAANWTRFCAGDSIELPGAYVERCGIDLKFLVADPGKLVAIEGLAAAKAISGVEFGLFYEPGDVIPVHIDDGSRTGWLIAEGEDRIDAMKKAEKVSEVIQFMTEAYDD